MGFTIKTGDKISENLDADKRWDNSLLEEKAETGMVSTWVRRGKILLMIRGIRLLGIHMMGKLTVSAF